MLSGLDLPQITDFIYIFILFELKLSVRLFGLTNLIFLVIINVSYHINLLISLIHISFIIVKSIISKKCK